MSVSSFYFLYLNENSVRDSIKLNRGVHGCVNMENLSELHPCINYSKIIRLCIITNNLNILSEKNVLFSNYKKIHLTLLARENREKFVARFLPHFRASANNKVFRSRYGRLLSEFSQFSGGNFKVLGARNCLSSSGIRKKNTYKI